MAGAKARRGPQHLGPSMLGEGGGGNDTPSAPRPNSRYPNSRRGATAGPSPPSVSQPGGAGRGEQEAPEPPHCPYMDSTAPELLPPARMPGPAPHLPLYPTSPSLPYTTFFTPHQPPISLCPTPSPTSAPLPHINPSHHLPNPHLCPTSPHPTTSLIPISAPHHPLNTSGPASQLARIEFLPPSSP